jgi:hypothetical protein
MDVIFGSVCKGRMRMMMKKRKKKEKKNFGLKKDEAGGWKNYTSTSTYLLFA